MKSLPFSKKGFTLLEILLVVAAIAILAGIVIVAINPGKQLADTRNATRQSDVKTISDAIYQYSFDHGGVFPSGIDTTWRILGTNSAGCAVNCGAVSESGNNQEQLNLSPVSQYSFDSGNASTIPDTSGPNNLVNNGVTFTAGMIGQGANCDGNGSASLVTNSLNPGAGDFYLAAWVKSAADSSNLRGIVGKPFYGSGGDEYGFGIYQGKFVFKTGDGAQMNMVWGPTFVPNNWYLLVGQRAGITTTFYVNNVAQGYFANVTGSIDTANPFVVCRSDNASVLKFIGQVDEVYFGTRSLTNSEMAQLYNQGLGIPSGNTTPPANATTADSCLDLSSALVSDYITAIPTDPKLGNANNTYYAVKKTSGGRISVQACAAENGKNITATK